MIKGFNSFIAEKSLCAGSDRVLLAVSGGMDSMAMARLFSLARIGFAFVHCNFKLRGLEADADEAFVKKAAESYGVECYSRSFETKEIAEDSGDSIQMIARDLRYVFFREVADRHGFDLIATAHHLDDQTETFFINLMRGCGIAGLHGIPLRSGKIIRPMMFAYRKDIENFVAENGIDYREDASNQSLQYTRNRIRHEILPQFLEMNPSFAEEMSGNIERLSQVEVVFRQFISIKKTEVIQQEGDVISIDIERLKALEPLPVFMYEFIAEYGFKKEDVPNIIRALDGISGKVFLSPGHQLLIDRDKIFISPLTNPTAEEILIQEHTSRVESPVILTIEKHTAAAYVIPADKQTASLDLEKLSFPMIIRRWQQGDTFIPLGMKNHKKLSDFFIDEKFSLLEKEKTWVLCSGGDIAWIVGHRIDDRYKITGSTKKVYQIRHQEPGPHEPIA